MVSIEIDWLVMHHRADYCQRSTHSGQNYRVMYIVPSAAFEEENK